MNPIATRRALGAALMILALLTTACDRAPSPGNPGSPATTTATHPASAKTLPRIDLAGFQRLIDQAKRDKQFLVIDFWATWCPPCVELFPDLHDRMANLGPRVRLVSVTMDSPGKEEAAAVDFLNQHHAMNDAYQLIPDDQARADIVKHLARKWQDQVVPAILVFGPDGQLAAEYLDADTYADVITKGVTKLLENPAATQP